MAGGGLTVDKNDIYYSEIGNYCLMNEKVHDVQFLVGVHEKRIGAVRSQLVNQSRVWWSMLSSESGLCEVKDIKVPDIEPEVFTIMLKHCYGGLPDCKDISEDIAVRLCYCANKYEMKALMVKLTVRLNPTRVDQVFAAIHCYVNYNLSGVKEGIEKFLSTEAKLLIDSSMFLELDVESVTYICQSKLNCSELSLWLAVVKWAKHEDDEGEEKRLLRDRLWKPLQHIRLLTLGKDNLYNFVFTEEVLTVKEIASICRGNTIGINTICKETTIRNTY